jgi:hypothetical protein
MYIKKAERLKRIEKLKDLGAPPELIQHEKFLSTLSYKEYFDHVEEQNNKEKQDRLDYAKNNKLNETVVENIINWFKENGDSIPLHVFESQVLTDNAINPLGPYIGMSEDDYYYDLYTPLVQEQINQLIKNRTQKK